MAKPAPSLNLENSCRMDKDCIENYHCQPSGEENHSNQLKSKDRGFRMVSRKFSARGFEFLTNGTCVLRGNLELIIEAA
jgi:hypothetical protein